MDGLVAVSVKADSERARLAAMVSEHFDFVWRLVRRLGIGREDADDATQQVFLAVVRRVGAVAPGREKAFLYGTAIRVIANLRRSVRRRREAHGTEPDAMESTLSAPDRQAELGQARDCLDEILSRLPERLSALFVLVEIEELDVSEAAALEGIPAGTAASRLRRARELFELELEKLGERRPFGANGGEP